MAIAARRFGATRGGLAHVFAITITIAVPSLTFNPFERCGWNVCTSIKYHEQQHQGKAGVGYIEEDLCEADNRGCTEMILAFKYFARIRIEAQWSQIGCSIAL